MSDDVLDRMRAAAADTPRVTVDRGAVLRAGRRRRVARVAGGAGLSVALVAATITGVAALAPDGPAGPVGADDSPTGSPSPTPGAYDEAYGPVEVVAGVAEVDAEAGTIVLPLDAYRLSADDWDVIDAAQDVFLDACFEDAGYGEYYEPGEALWQSSARHAQEAHRYGVWQADDVRERGYAGLLETWATPEEEVSGLPFTDEMAAASRGCYRAMLDAGLSYEPETTTADAPLGVPPVTLMPEADEALAAWVGCLDDAGVAAALDDSGVLAPPGVWAEPFDEQVRIGLIDVQCKAETDLVQRLADVEAAYQLAYIERGGTWLEDFAAVQEEVLRTAEEYLAAHEAGTAG